MSGRTCRRTQLRYATEKSIRSSSQRLNSMNKRRRSPLWLIAIILPPIVSSILGAIYDWEIAGAAALLGLLSLPVTLLFCPQKIQTSALKLATPTNSALMNTSVA